MVLVDRGTARLRRAGSGSYSHRFGHGGGRSSDGLTRVTNGIWAHGWARRSGRGQSLNPRFLVQQAPELRGELSGADVGCVHPPRRNGHQCFLVWTQTPIREVRALWFWGVGGDGRVLVTLGMLLSLWNWIRKIGLCVRTFLPKQDTCAVTATCTSLTGLSLE